MNTTNPWYVAVDDTTVGPAPTDLVIRGIEHRKIPPEALVCPVGTGTWRPLASVAEFHAAVVRSYPPPPSDSEESRSWIERGYHFPSLGALPQFSYDAADETSDDRSGCSQTTGLFADDGDDDWDSDTTLPTKASPDTLESAPDIEPEAPELELARASMADVEPEANVEARMDSASDIDVDIDDGLDDGADIDVAAAGAPAIDWSERFQSYFLVGDEVELPEQRALLESLASASTETFRHDEALWNLALCLAFGSDVVGEAAARTFFSAVAGQGSAERLEWMSRTLLGQGFVPSGIPVEAGRRACRRLRSSCPPAFARELPASVACA